MSKFAAALTAVALVAGTPLTASAVPTVIATQHVCSIYTRIFVLHSNPRCWAVVMKYYPEIDYNYIQRYDESNEIALIELNSLLSRLEEQLGRIALTEEQLEAMDRELRSIE